jgi:DNA modification methylase
MSMQIAKRYELVPIGKIVPRATNPRKHSTEQIAQIRSSFREFGVLSPCLVDENYSLLAGHGRLLAAQAEGLSELNCVVVDGLSEAQKKAFVITDNQLTINSSWDSELLALEFEELKDLGFDLELTGFSTDEIDKLFADANLKDIEEDDFDIDAAADESSFVLRGDLWHLKNHRLLCDDSTCADAVSRLMNGKKATLLLTDFPYGVSYESKAGKIANDELRGEEFYAFLLKVFKNIEMSLSDDASAYVFHADTNGELFRRAFREAGFKLSGVCQWIKPSLVLGHSPYQWQNEPILFGWKDKGKHKWYAGRSETTIWQFEKPKRNDIHPTMKPLDLLAYPIKNSSAVNSIVLDVFSGSFSTGMVCEQLNRICYAIELDERYASASIKRFIESYGSDAVTVERDGKILCFPDVYPNR